MITFNRDDKKVCLKVSDGPLGAVYHFNWDCDDTYYAELLANHFDSKLDKLVQRIREEEYQRGYKEGRGKKAKKTWFSPLLKLNVA
jgi:hypothetical protein